jgi:hypothetical protein
MYNVNCTFQNLYICICNIVYWIYTQFINAYALHAIVSITGNKRIPKVCEIK